LEKLDAIERRLQAISGETHALPERIRGALEARPIGEVLADALKARD
jgi:hypothetical protein